ncbi:MAG: SurA N-terminal domain-containing protein [Candidatus Margulisbacteria bacterium]|jgi:foldase protein PrsA|nr:SurA N-terminal domain-containing protein [Candidatus Margulisiibacteriota bacterium]
MRKYFLWIFLLAFGLAAGRYAALVNGEEISLRDFETAVEAAQKTLLTQSSLDLESEEGKFLLMTTQRSILDDMINQAIIRQQARQMHIAVTSADVAAEIERLRQGFPSQKVFEETLAAENINTADLAEGVRSRLVSEKIKKELSSRLDISDKELTNFMRSNKDFFIQNEHRRYAQILLAGEQEAEETLAELKAGADFAELAKARSIDKQSADAGGDIGYLELGAYDPQTEDVLFKLQAGELSPVLELPEGYAIFYCAQITATPPEDIDRSSSEARKYLLRKKENELFERWFTKTRNAAKIEINPDIKLRDDFLLPDGAPQPHPDKIISNERV